MIPILFPVAMALGFDPIWFGIVIVMTVELGLITPPIGMNVFVINSLARDVSLQKIYAGVMPFVLTDIIRLGLIPVVPRHRSLPAGYDALSLDERDKKSRPVAGSSDLEVGTARRFFCSRGVSSASGRRP